MKEFVEYDNGRNTVPYGATSICFCLTDYAKKYIIEDRVITKGVNDDVRDAVVVDAINYLGTKEQWENIPKGEEWNAYTPMNIIRCVDGEIKL